MKGFWNGWLWLHAAALQHHWLTNSFHLALHTDGSPVVEVSTVTINTSFPNYPHPAGDQTIKTAIFHCVKCSEPINITLTTMLFCALFESLYIILTTLYIRAINIEFLFIRHVQYAWMIFKTRRKSAFVDVDMLIITSELISILDHTVQGDKLQWIARKIGDVAPQNLVFQKRFCTFQSEIQSEILSSSLKQQLYRRHCLPTQPNETIRP